MAFYPGNQDLVQKLMAMKRQAQLTGRVNPDYASVVQGSLAEERNNAYRDAMLGLQEKGLALKERAQGAEESQYAQKLALMKQGFSDQMSAADAARRRDLLTSLLGAGIMGGYLGMKGLK